MNREKANQGFAQIPLVLVSVIVALAGIYFLPNIKFFNPLKINDFKNDSKTQAGNKTTSTKEPVPTPTYSGPKDSDIVTCSFDPKCDQSPMMLKESVCRNATCCNIGLDYWVATLTIAECRVLQNKAIEIYKSIYKSAPPVTYNQYVPPTLQYQYQPIVIPTLSVNTPTIPSAQANQNTDYSSICNAQFQTDQTNARVLGGNAGEAILEMAQQNFDRCMNTGISQPLKITKPSPTPTVLQGIWYGNLGPLE